MMLDDWVHVAYTAARAGDQDGALGAVAEISREGRRALDVAMHKWMNRTLTVMHTLPADARAMLRLEMQTDGTGEPVPIDSLPPDQAWAGRMFMAHCTQDKDRWEALWTVVPAGPDTVTDYVYTLLTVMTTTAAAAAENVEQADCCWLHRGSSADPELTGDRIAVSHLN